MEGIVGTENREYYLILIYVYLPPLLPALKYRFLSFLLVEFYFLFFSVLRSLACYFIKFFLQFIFTFSSIVPLPLPSLPLFMQPFRMRYQQQQRKKKKFILPFMQAFSLKSI